MKRKKRKRRPKNEEGSADDERKGCRRTEGMSTKTVEEVEEGVAACKKRICKQEGHEGRKDLHERSEIVL
jgi:hypothetical protein